MNSQKFKVLLIGTNDSQKTQLIEDLIDIKFSKSYKKVVVVDILTLNIEYAPNQYARLSIWDIDSQKRFNNILSSICQGIEGIIFVFALTNAQSYRYVLEKYKELKSYAGDAPFILIANNRSKLEKEKDNFNREEAEIFANSEGGIYFEISSEKGESVEKILKEFIKRIIYWKHN
jgi:small GTP-binding protein